MKLLPYDTFTIQTTDPLPIVLERLAMQIEPEQPVRWHVPRTHAPYEGTISDAGFQIRRIIHYRNSFLPVIRGRLTTSPSGTHVHISLRLHSFVIAFLVFWYLAWYSFFLPIWFTGAMPTIVALQFIGLPIAVLVAFWAAFWTEAHRSREDLVRIILGQPTPAPRPFQRFQWVPKALQWLVVLLGIALGSLQMTGTFRPSHSVDPEVLAAASCAQHPHHSPTCQLALVHTLVGHPTATTLAISADGQTLVSGGTDKAIKIWDLKTGQLQKTLQSNSGTINAVAIAPDGKTVVSGSADRMVRIWDLTTDQRPKMLAGHPQEVTLVSVTPDGKTVISGSYGAIKQWDLATGQLKATFPQVGKTKTMIGPVAVIDDEAEQFRPIAISSSSSTALISDLKVVDLNTNQAHIVPTDKVANLFADNFRSAYLSPDGKLAALQFGNNFRKFETRLKVWELATGNLLAETHATTAENFFADVPLALSRDRIFGIKGGQLNVWQTSTAQLEAVLDTGWMSSLVVTPDNKLLAGLSHEVGLDQQQIKVWRQPSP